MNDTVPEIFARLFEELPQDTIVWRLTDGAEDEVEVRGPQPAGARRHVLLHLALIAARDGFAAERGLSPIPIAAAHRLLTDGTKNPCHEIPLESAYGFVAVRCHQPRGFYTPATPFTIDPIVRLSVTHSSGGSVAQAYGVRLKNGKRCTFAAKSFVYLPHKEAVMMRLQGLI